MKELGPVGIWSGSLAKVPASQARDGAAKIESLGYSALWYPESTGSKESFAQGAFLLSATKDIVVASGIANLWARDTTAMVAGANTLGEAWPGRFILGVGVSNSVTVPLRGHVFANGFTALKDYVAGMEEIAYTSPPPSTPVPRVLGSIGPKSMAFAAEAGWGVHTYFVPEQHTPYAREIIGDDTLLAVEMAVVIEREPDKAREIARGHMGYYLMRPPYQNMLKRAGYTDEDIAGPSDRLVDAIVAWGSPDDIARRVQSHLNNGADHVCLQPLGSAATDVALGQLEELAKVVL